MPTNEAAEEEKSSSQKNVKSKDVAFKAKKELAAKKKAAMLAKMKKKQTAFIVEPQIKLENQQPATAEQTTLFNQSCASCQEPLDLA